jgi:hypothetical protein
MTVFWYEFGYEFRLESPLAFLVGSAKSMHRGHSVCACSTRLGRADFGYGVALGFGVGVAFPFFNNSQKPFPLILRPLQALRQGLPPRFVNYDLSRPKLLLCCFGNRHRRIQRKNVHRPFPQRISCVKVLDLRINFQDIDRKRHIVLGCGLLRNGLLYKPASSGYENWNENGRHCLQ